MKLKIKETEVPVRYFLNVYEMWQNLNVRKTVISFMLNHLCEKNGTLYRDFMAMRDIKTIPESYEKYLVARQQIINDHTHKPAAGNVMYTPGLKEALEVFDNDSDSRKAIRDSIQRSNEIFLHDHEFCKIFLFDLPVMDNLNDLTVWEAFVIQTMFCNPFEWISVKDEMISVNLIVANLHEYHSMIEKFTFNAGPSTIPLAAACAKINFMYYFHRTNERYKKYIIEYDRPRTEIIEELAVKNELNEPVIENNIYTIPEWNKYKEKELRLKESCKDVLDGYEFWMNMPLQLEFLPISLEDLPSDLGAKEMKFLSLLIPEKS